METFTLRAQTSPDLREPDAATGDETTTAAPRVAFTMVGFAIASKLDDAGKEQNHDNDDDDADDSYATTSCVHLDLLIERRIRPFASPLGDVPCRSIVARESVDSAQILGAGPTETGTTEGRGAGKARISSTPSP